MSSIEEEISDRIEKIINQIESGEIKKGDTVYCTKNEHNVVILELPKLDLIEKYNREKKNNGSAPFSGRIKYKTKGRGKIGYAPIITIIKIQDKNISMEFSISKENYQSSHFSDLSYEVKKKGMTIKKQFESNNYNFVIYGETKNSLYDAFSGYFSLFENLKFKST